MAEPFRAEDYNVQLWTSPWLFRQAPRILGRGVNRSYTGMTVKHNHMMLSGLPFVAVFLLLRVKLDRMVN